MNKNKKALTTERKRNIGTESKRLLVKIDQMEAAQREVEREHDRIVAEKDKAIAERNQLIAVQDGKIAALEKKVEAKAA